MRGSCALALLMEAFVFGVCEAEVRHDWQHSISTEQSQTVERVALILTLDSNLVPQQLARRSMRRSFWRGCANRSSRYPY